MKYKIIKISEPTSDYELQAAKDIKEFNNTIVKLVASTAAIPVGYTIMSAGFNTDFSAITTAFGVTMAVICGGVINPKLISRLNNIYNNKNTSVSVVVAESNEEKESEDELSGGIKR